MSVRHANQICAALAALFVAGCAGEPLWLNFISINPSVRRKWEEDELYSPTYYARRDELQALRRSVAQMPQPQQEEMARALADLLRREPNTLLRREAVLTIGHLATPAAIPALQSALTDDDPDVRIAACAAWRRRGGPEAAGALASVIGSDQDLDVRIAAAAELSHFRGQVAMDALAVAIEDPDPALQYRAVLSLQEVSDRDYGQSVYAWREFLHGNQPPLPETPSLVERMTSWF